MFAHRLLVAATAVLMAPMALASPLAGTPAGGQATASHGSAAAPSSGASSSGPRVQRHQTPNGLLVLVAENHAVPLVTVEIAVKNGAMTEPPKYAGLSHLYEHMFFKANAVYPSQEAYLARVNELGIRFNGTTGTERVNYYFTTTSDKVNESMEFMRDAILTLRFDAKELEKERVVVTGEMDRAEASPYYWFGRNVDRKLWYKYPTRKEPIGSRKTVLSATTAMMRTIQKRYYLPNNSLLIVTGDVKAKEIFAQADKLYAGWKKGGDPFVKYPLAKHPPLKKSEVVVTEKPVRTFVGKIAWHGPSTVANELPATYAADVLGTAVSLPTSRFQRALVDSGACLGASLSWYTQRNVGPIALQFAAAPRRVKPCVAAVMKELSALAKPDYVGANELASAAFRLRVDKVKEREKPSSFAHVLSFWWASAGLDYYFGYADKVKQVGASDIEKFVATYIKGKPFVFGALVSPGMKQAGLTKKALEEMVGLRKATSKKGAGQ